MLLYLFDYLSQYYSGFNVFQYLTLRIILAALTALFTSLILGPPIIQILKNRNFDSYFDRITIQTYRGEERITCYNIKKVGKYGICKTEEDNSYPCGFCGKSCFTYQSTEYHQSYEEAKFLYFEEAPPLSSFRRDKGNKYQLHIRLYVTSWYLLL